MISPPSSISSHGILSFNLRLTEHLIWFCSLGTRYIQHHLTPYFILLVKCIRDLFFVAVSWMALNPARPKSLVLWETKSNINVLRTTRTNILTALEHKCLVILLCKSCASSYVFHVGSRFGSVNTLMCLKLGSCFRKIHEEIDSVSLEPLYIKRCSTENAAGRSFHNYYENYQV